MRRAISQLFPATAPGQSWLSQLGASGSGQSALRSTSEVSTSYSASSGEAVLPALVRGFGAKGKAAAKAAPPPPPPKPAAPPGLQIPLSAGARLRRRTPPVDPLSLLSPQQRALAETLVSAPLPHQQPAPAEGADSPTATAPAAGPPFRGLGQLPLPLDARDVGSLVQQALSNAAGQNVHFQPFVFSNLFQSASVAASYVAAALESGVSWARVERFFLAAVEADTVVRGIRVRVGGRLGRKADKASSKVWEWGDFSLHRISDRLDYGAAPAMTRLGTLGVKVWIRYKPGAINDVFFPATGGSHYGTPVPAAATPTRSLDGLYAAAVARSTRVALPYDLSAVAWWQRPAGQQPAENRVGEVLSAGIARDSEYGRYDPAGGDTLAAYLDRRREAERKFRTAAERRTYLATIGRFLKQQRRMARARAAAAAAAGASGAVAAVGPMGRRRTRPLARFKLDPFLPKRWNIVRRRAAAAATAFQSAAGSGTA